MKLQKRQMVKTAKTQSNDTVVAAMRLTQIIAGIQACIEIISSSSIHFQEMARHSH
jgi:hypothetical protein